MCHDFDGYGRQEYYDGKALYILLRHLYGYHQLEHLHGVRDLYYGD
jgi:hypothetical protein